MSRTSSSSAPPKTADIRRPDTKPGDAWLPGPATIRRESRDRRSGLEQPLDHRSHARLSRTASRARPRRAGRGHTGTGRHSPHACACRPLRGTDSPRPRGHRCAGAARVYAMPRMRRVLEHAGSMGTARQAVEHRDSLARGRTNGAPERTNHASRRSAFLTATNIPRRSAFASLARRARSSFCPTSTNGIAGIRVSRTSSRVPTSHISTRHLYRDGEVPGRAMSEIPHPFMQETMARFADAPAAERAKIRFIHLNRTNPVAFPESDERRAVEQRGFSCCGDARDSPAIGPLLGVRPDIRG